MKTKPILIALGFVAIVILNSCKTTKTTDEANVRAFLVDFNSEIKAGNPQAVLTYFDGGANSKANKVLVNVLCNKSGINGKGEPLFTVSFDIDKAEIGLANGKAEVMLPLAFKYPDLPTATSHINLSIHKTDNNGYKISSVKTRPFTVDYKAYQHKVIQLTTPSELSFQPITLAAFKTADNLKARYDSVLWFQHINNKTWFYVINGKLPEHFYWQDPAERPSAINYKMGLVSPDLKEIVPAEYDMVHNIGGTIDGLIEVEKNGKKGFYDMAGKLVAPVTYNMIVPLINDDINIALLNSGSDFFYLRKDLTTSEKIADFKIADVLQKIKLYSDSYSLSEKSTNGLMEYNSKYSAASLVVPPSYLVEWNILSKFVDLKNPLRKLPENEIWELEGSASINVKHEDTGDKEEGNWFEVAYHTIVDDYLGSRSGLYTSKSVVVVNNKQNTISGFKYTSYFGGSEGGGMLSGKCNENRLRAINDTLFEFKTTSEFDRPIVGNLLLEGPYYHYLVVKNGALERLPSQRLFPTQFVKLDDSYLQGCYILGTGDDEYHPSKKELVDHLTPALLQYMKNEIYASYHYKFKNPQWTRVFESRFSRYDDAQNANVEDSLTVIDKYNIEWINKKLKITKPTVAALR